MVENDKFNNYVETYKQLPLQEKKNIVNDEVKKLLAIIEKAKGDIGLQSQLILNKEILDLNQESVSDDDFVEAMFVYIHTIQESLGDYFNEIVKYIYK